MNNDVSIVLAGEAGQGVKTIELLMVEILKIQKHFFFISREYMSRVRGGINSTQILISDYPVNSYRDQTDLFISLTDNAEQRYKYHISDKTTILNKDRFIEIAKKNGNKKYANSVVFGYICAYIGSQVNEGMNILKKKYSSKPDTIDGNIRSFINGYDLFSGEAMNIISHPGNYTTFDTSTAIAYGAIFGGCNFIASYPMSPSTGVLTNLAQLSKDHDVLVEQAEDEIAAINMALGASYAGARAMVTTSGGGFALMEEGISLCGAIETPVVIHLAQRPGPATGLPTRTEQGDFTLALYSGHGDFQKVIFSPGDQIEAIETTMSAFNIADEYQISVIILTDQYILDSIKPIKVSDIPKPETIKKIIKTDKEYKRYLFTTSGVSPRGIPGYGDGIVRVDSDEHDENGRITENSNIRKKMVEKRNIRLEELKKASIPPTFIGEEEYKRLYVCYGSNLGIALDLEKECNKNECAFLHFSQLHPLSNDIEEYFKKAKELIIFENNYTGQYADYLETRFSFKFKKRILKYNGDPFSIEDLLKDIEVKT